MRHLLPRAVRDRYRERVFLFQLNTLPHVKYKIQSRIHRYLLGRYRKRADKSRVLDAVARHGKRLLLGPPRRRPAKDANKTRQQVKGQDSMPNFAGLATGYGPGSNDGMPDPGERGERGYRRRKLAAMAGNLYRTGQQAVTDMRESYAQTRAANGEYEVETSTHIPGAFPDVAIMAKGGEEMVLFPSYAKRHVKKDWSRVPLPQQTSNIEQGTAQSEEHWKQEWEKHEDEKAIVDVDVRGWIYSPQTGPITRRNRILIGLARQLSGISAPRVGQNSEGLGSQGMTHHQMHEELREQERIAQEAAMIERRGQQEKKVAYAGGYSEKPPETSNLGADSIYDSRPQPFGTKTPDSVPGSPTLSARQGSTLGNELTEAELAVANANLMARIAPFMTNPLVAQPITIFLYNETQSQSRTVLTNDAGHFIVRIPLDFVPTEVRVLANEQLSATQEVKVIEPHGISLISDIDDTVKKSNISAGAREIFRNTFIRELGDLSVEGVRQWYNDMHRLGVSMHYCSNSPWQLFPVLASYFKLAGLPPGSLHLKQYSGMLQGIFEPVAERKKGTLMRVMKDFPSRKFILVGDSGEADLEVYTELAMAFPKNVLAIFIRDVTTPERVPYFEPGFDPLRRKMSSTTLNDGQASLQNKPPRQSSAPAPSHSTEKPVSGPIMGTLIDFTEEPEPVSLDGSATTRQTASSGPAKTTSAMDLLSARKQPPPRPSKPASLRSVPSFKEGDGANGSKPVVGGQDTRPSPPPRKPIGMSTGQSHPLAQTQNASQKNVVKGQVGESKASVQPRGRVPDISIKKDDSDAAPPPLPRRPAAPFNPNNLSPRLQGRGRDLSSNSDVDFDPLPPSAAPAPAPTGLNYFRSSSRSGATTPSGSPTLGAQGVNRKLEMWKRRLVRAHEELDQLGIALYTWRRGQDVEVEARAIVERELRESGATRRVRG